MWNRAIHPNATESETWINGTKSWTFSSFSFNIVKDTAYTLQNKTCFSLQRPQIWGFFFPSFFLVWKRITTLQLSVAVDTPSTWLLNDIFENCMQESSSIAWSVPAAGASGEASKDTSAADLFTERTEFDI